MFGKYMKITEEDFVKAAKEIGEEAKKEFKEQYQALLNKYLDLKKEHEGQQKKYIKALNENDILKAKLKELQKTGEVEEKETIDKYSDLANKLFSDKK